ncbi:formylglycine-generating enzyme family protein [Streptomyces sp. NPDC004284]|uniref:formylglycine-generating enzyme family protein n=1 Tax=Streptomyces sp. NPDC004284 TaxID=3364695 RepID=UPI0036B9EC83
MPDRGPGRNCCSPSRGGTGRRTVTPGAAVAAAGGRADGMVRIPGGEFLMGSEDGWAVSGEGEGPVHPVRLAPFRIGSCAVSDAESQDFSDATGYVTDAERYGWSFVFTGPLPADSPGTRAVAEAPWWRQMDGACRRHPEGPSSDVRDRADHPVVHVSWNDATAYAAWAGKRLPTEAEGEFAARGGLERRAFPRGDELEPGGGHRTNVGQGGFPAPNTGADGWYGTAPVTAHPPSGYGLHPMCGNVWGRCADRYAPGCYRSSPPDDPQGPPVGPGGVIRGGSYLCHASYRRRYRVSARSSVGPDGGTGNQGFHCAADDTPAGAR